MNKQVKSYQLSYGNLAYLLEQNGIDCHLYSPLEGKRIKAKLVNKEKIDAPDLKDLLMVIAMPKAKITMRFGGSSTATSEQVICLSDDKTVGIIFTKMDIRILDYNDRLSVAEAFVLEYANKSEVVAPNILPSFCSIEEFVCLLHSIDMYRREYYKSMMTYNKKHGTGFTIKDFLEFFQASIKAKDTRWLLPCFFMIIPNLELKKIQMKNEDINILVNSQLCQMMKNDDTDEVGLYFTSEGKGLGIEFERTWRNSTGIEISRLQNGEQEILSRVFIATTALSNHFIELISDEGIKINHQSYNYDQLHKRLSELIQLI